MSSIGSSVVFTPSTFANLFKDEKSDPETKMPVLFCAHGSPMNAIENNSFTRSLKTLGSSLPRPKAILCISAHWLTRGTYVNVSPQPKMIYDMHGFPDELYRVKYSSIGAPQIANEIQNRVTSTKVLSDTEWGYDHGNWSIMRHLFPGADIPVFQMSLDYNQPMQYHYDLAKELLFLRSKGVLIVGSGNITHNLRLFDSSNINVTPTDWALEFDELIKKAIDEGDHSTLIKYSLLKNSSTAVPEPSHYLPLIYISALRERGDVASYPYEGFHYGSFSMRCLKYESN